MQVKIKKINYSDTKKDGTKYVSKFGKPFYKVGLQTEEHGEKWINGILPFAPTDWEGKIKDLEITEDEKWGTQFSLTKRNAPADLGKLEAKVDSCLALLRRIANKVDPIEDNYPQEDSEELDMPF